MSIQSTTKVQAPGTKAAQIKTALDGVPMIEDPQAINVGPDKLVVFRDAYDRPLFEAVLIGRRLRVFSPIEKFAVIPEDRMTVELMPFRDAGDPPFEPLPEDGK